jgi:6-phosphogluconolactonase
MKSPLLLTLSLACLLSPAAWAEGQLVYVSCSDDRRVQVYSIEPDGALEKRFRLELQGKPGPMALSPDRSRIYVAVAGARSPKGRLKRRHSELSTLKRLANGSLEVEGAIAVENRPTYLRVDPSGKRLLTASYGAGQVSVYAILNGLCTRRLDQKATERTAHCVELDPSGRFAFVPHTTPNVIYQFRFDGEAGTLAPNAPPTVAGPDAGHGYHEPRHVRFHPTLPMAYTSNERGGGISGWRLDPETGTLTREQTVGSLPPGFKGESAAAEIRITPNGRFAYVSNRDKGPGKADTLAGFAIDTKGTLRAIGHFPTAAFPRSFAIDLTGAFVYAAGQKDGQLACYRIDQKTGALQPIGRIDVGQRPSWVLCATAD